MGDFIRWVSDPLLPKKDVSRELWMPKTLVCCQAVSMSDHLHTGTHHAKCMPEDEAAGASS